MQPKIKKNKKYKKKTLKQTNASAHVVRSKSEISEGNPNGNGTKDCSGKDL